MMCRVEVEAYFASYVADLPRFAYLVAFILLPLPFFGDPSLRCLCVFREEEAEVSWSLGGTEVGRVPTGILSTEGEKHKVQCREA